jgi:hypothetical protein
VAAKITRDDQEGCVSVRDFRNCRDFYRTQLKHLEHSLLPFANSPGDQFHTDLPNDISHKPPL